MNRKYLYLPVITLIVILLFTSAYHLGQASPLLDPGGALTSAFTYQGQLNRNSLPFTGACDFTFALWDSAAGGSQLGSSEPKTGVSVAGGVFTVQLNETGQFGANAFTSSQRWLDIQVKCGSDTAFTGLGRQMLATAPFASYSLNADKVDGLQPGSASGNIPISNGALNANLNADLLDGLQPGSASGNIPVSNGALNASLNADLLDGQHAAGFQNRVSGACAVGSSIRAIHADGTVECEQPVTFYYPLMQINVLNLASVDASLKGFVGGFTDGAYGYMVPYNNGSFSGKVARVDLNNYTTGGVLSLDLTLVDSALKGFYGGFTDGLFGYFVPNLGGTSGKVARVNLRNFNVGQVTVLDLAAVDGGLKGFRGGFTDGNYGYFVPYQNEGGPSGKIARVNLLTFDTSTVTVLDLQSVYIWLAGYNGGFTDGRYAYFVPGYNQYINYHGMVVRVDLQNFTPSGVSVLNLAAVDGDLAGFSSGFTDGRYGYFVPYMNNSGYSGKVARVDLSNFTASGVTVLDLGAMSSNLTGFTGGFTDGHYGYFVPYHGSALARVDLANFTPSGVTTRLTWFSNFGGSFTDGRYGYLVPYYSAGNPDGQMMRIQMFSGIGGP